MNILLITLDQFRGDHLGCAAHPLARTPNLDGLAAEGVRFARHYSQAAPCGPGRASLYTGLYQMNHRVVANGTPLDARFDNIAHAARRAGYAPTLFGYTDQAFDPRAAEGPDDPRLRTYEEVLPGFEVGLHMPADEPTPWLDWLRSLGHSPPASARDAYATERLRPAEHSCSAFVAGALIGWIERRETPWFAHLSQFRPHPPYAAAGEFAAMFDPDAVGEPSAPWEDLGPLYAGLRANRHTSAPADPAHIRRIRAQYLGMIAEADAQLGRVFAAIVAAGQWDETFVVVTSDHGEQLGDHGLIGKGGFFEESYHVPCIVRDPRAGAARGLAVERFSEAVDVFPTLCEAMGIEVPAQCDGAPLTPFLRGETPEGWREAAHWEFDWRGVHIASGEHPWPWDRRLERQNLAVHRGEGAAYVHFADGSSLAFDLAADPSWRTPLSDPAAVLAQAQGLLTWRARHTDRTLTGMLNQHGPVGRLPPGLPWGLDPAQPVPVPGHPATTRDRNGAVRRSSP